MADASTRIPSAPRRPASTGAAIDHRWRHLRAAGLALTCFENGDIEGALAASCVGLRLPGNPPDALADHPADHLDDGEDPPTPTPELPQ